MSNKYLAGTVVGSLEVLNYLPQPGQGRNKFKCRCIKCNTEVLVWATTIYKLAKTKGNGCKICRDIRYRRTDELPALRRMFISYQANAKSRAIKFELTLEEFRFITENNCFYCNASPTERKAPKQWQPSVYLSGLDRKNNLESYNFSNSVACCYDCNRSKSDLGEQEFADWCKRLSDHKWWTE